MRAKSVTVTSSNSPYYIPVNEYGGVLGVTATPNSGNYDVAYTHERPSSYDFSAVANWTDITGMSAATTAASVELGPAACLRVTLNSGTSVQVDVTQNRD